MKLNPDCIRAVLLYVEETQKFGSKGFIEEIESRNLIEKR